MGVGDARGTKVNVPMPPYAAGEQWLAAFDAIVPPLVTGWNPQVLVTQLGCDTHATDPLAQLWLTTNTYRQTARRLHRLAHDAAGGRWLATGGGGYQWARVVPRAWTLYFAEMAGEELPDDLPLHWLEAAEREAGYELPSTLSDPDLHPHTEVAIGHVIDEVRREIFPLHGLG